jgi:hypothetical protein
MLRVEQSSSLHGRGGGDGGDGDGDGDPRGETRDDTTREEPGGGLSGRGKEVRALAGAGRGEEREGMGGGALRGGGVHGYVFGFNTTLVYAQEHQDFVNGKCLQELYAEEEAARRVLGVEDCGYAAALQDESMVCLSLTKHTHTLSLSVSVSVSLCLCLSLSYVAALLAI